MEIGDSASWTPGSLLSLAAQSSLMIEFLRLAKEAALPVLGYVSSGEGVTGPAGRAPATLILSPCIVVGSRQDCARAERLLEEAMEASPVCRLLRGGTELNARLVVMRSPV